MKTKILLTLLVLLTLSVCRADIIYLKSGGKLTGSVVEEDEKSVTLILGHGGKAHINKEMIERIEYTFTEDAEKALEEARKLKGEAQTAAGEANWAKAVSSYREAILQCEKVREEAGELYTKAVPFSSELREKLKIAVRELLQQANSLFDKGEYARSIECYKVYLASSAHDTEAFGKLTTAYIRFGKSLYQEERFDEARRQFEACTELAPSNDEAVNYLSLVSADMLYAEAKGDRERQQYSSASVKYNRASDIYTRLAGKIENMGETLRKKATSAKAEAEKCSKLALENVELQPIWIEDYEKATALARKYKRPVLINFTGSDWCGWCKKLKSEVFSTPTFTSYASKNLVLLEIDFPKRKPQSAKLRKQNAELAKKYNIRGYPSIVLIDQSGRQIARTGYREGGPQKYVEHLEALLSSSP